MLLFFTNNMKPQLTQALIYICKVGKRKSIEKNESKEEKRSFDEDNFFQR